MLAPAKMFPIILLGNTYLTSRTYATKRFQFSVYLLTCLPTYLSTYLPVYLPAWLPTLTLLVQSLHISTFPQGWFYCLKKLSLLCLVSEIDLP